MPIVRDFRNFHFEPRRIDQCGRFVGRNLYWKLYAIENLLRSIVHSVLSVQINPNWWNLAVDPKIRKKAQDIRQQYSQTPWHVPPGRHEIYFVFLSDLNHIIRANSNLFLPLLPDVDQWIQKVEMVRLPRNVVAHMNFPAQPDRQGIDAMYTDFLSLIARLQGSGLMIQIP